jgi:deoxyribodipyrimidine photo-lyase
MKTGLVWFRNNLRMDDNPALNKALIENDQVILLYVYDERLFIEEQFGIERMGGQKTRFLFQSVEDLKANLEPYDLYLHVAYANPVEYILGVVKANNVNKVYCQHEFGTEEAEDYFYLASKVSMVSFESGTLFNEDSLGLELQSLPLVFTDFRKIIEQKGVIQLPENFVRGKANSAELADDYYLHKFSDKMLDNHKNSAARFSGGETVGLERLKQYIWKNKSILTYKQTRNNLIGSDYSSKFSPWLANGCISPRRTLYNIIKFENKIKKNDSTYWLKLELFWREFFKWNFELHQYKLYAKSGLKSKFYVVNEFNDNFDNWASAKTINEFVNASMRELNSTGYLSNRGRQIVASYLINELKVDWRIGAAYFEKMLIDYDTSSNYGNWAYIAGVGNDPQGGRNFNVSNQINLYDPNGDYIKLWSN